MERGERINASYREGRASAQDEATVRALAEIAARAASRASG